MSTRSRPRDLEIREGGGGVGRGGGGRVGSGLQQIFFQPFRPQFGLKIGGGGGDWPPGPSPGSATAKGLPGHSIPILLLAFTRQLNILATALILHVCYVLTFIGVV